LLPIASHKSQLFQFLGRVDGLASRDSQSAFHPMIEQCHLYSQQHPYTRHPQISTDRPADGFECLNVEPVDALDLFADEQSAGQLQRQSLCIRTFCAPPRGCCHDAIFHL